MRLLRLGCNGLILADLRDKPTREAGEAGIWILLVGKPTGRDRRRFSDALHSITDVLCISADGSISLVQIVAS
jgi:hypothetical protein